MKSILLILAVFTVAITALHAQVLPGTVPPSLAPDPALQQIVNSILPTQYLSHGTAITIAIMLLCRVLQGRKNGLSWLASFKAALNGSNTPTKAPLIIGALCLLILPSCVGLQKLGAALSTPEARQVEMSLAKVGLIGAVAGGVVAPGDAITIAKGVAVITSADSTSSKVVQLEKLGLDTAVSKGVVKPGDVMQITEASAIITPAPAPIPPSNVVIPTVVPTAELESGK